MAKTRIHVDELRLGMQVLELDRPWLDTPFPFQGFELRTAEELAQLRALCTFVYIDGETAAAAPARRLRVLPGGAGAVEVRPAYRALEGELPEAAAMYQRARAHLERVFADVRIGGSLDLPATRRVVEELAESAIRNPAALLLLGNLHEANAHAAAHSVQVCALALAFGGHLGLGEAELRELGLGALLHDIGETRVAPELLARRNGLSPEERRALQVHAEIGAAILRGTEGMPRSAVEIALGHHEMLNGRGYPRGTAGEAIPLFARLVAIVDAYDNLTGGREGQPCSSCTQALKSMYQWRGELFDAALVEKFIECLGIYPVGSLVELESGELGIVIAVDPQRRLTPKLLLVRGRNGQPCEPPRIVDLALQALHGRTQRILQVHDPARLGIDVRAYILRELPWPHAGAV